MTTRAQVLDNMWDSRLFACMLTAAIHWLSRWVASSFWDGDRGAQKAKRLRPFGVSGDIVSSSLTPGPETDD